MGSALGVNVRRVCGCALSGTHAAEAVATAAVGATTGECALDKAAGRRLRGATRQPVRLGTQSASSARHDTGWRLKRAYCGSALASGLAQHRKAAAAMDGLHCAHCYGEKSALATVAAEEL